MEGENGEKRNEKGQFIPGYEGGPGRPPLTPEEKALKKAAKELIAEYKETLAQFLPSVAPVLIAKALDGDIPAIKELHDRAMGKAEQKTDVTSGGKPIPIIGAIPTDNSNQEASETEQTN